MTASRDHGPAAGGWRLRLEVDEPGSRLVAAVDADGTVIALASAGVTRDADALTGWELYSINVLPDRQGTGLADDLIRVTLGGRDATVWVVRGNTRAQAFYRRHGFSVEGATKLHEGTGASEIRMVRRSAAPER